MSYWLIKADPSEYSWEQLTLDRETDWNGVRNFQARKCLNAMMMGDSVLVYHTEDDREIVGIAEVVEQAKPDETATDGEWVSVRIKAIKPVGRTLTLDEIRNTAGLSIMPLVEQPRLSVMSVTPAQWEAILKYTKTV